MDYIIYKIVHISDKINLLYIGSTKDYKRRVLDHKKDSFKKDTILYKIIREYGGWENFNMVVLEIIENITKTEARIKEEEYRLTLNANMNLVRCHRTAEEKREQQKLSELKYKTNNKEKVRESDKKFKTNNKEKIRQYNLQKVICECGCELSRECLSRHRKTKKHLNLISR
tara:strand:+ start:930 stop:1442 length:513 start_codon:yes stop_codon:yes gene_type:complete